MNIKRNQMIDMVGQSYVTVVIYALILSALVISQGAFDLITFILLIFGSSSLISLVISTMIIRKHLIDDQDFVKVLLGLAIVHVPAILGFVGSLILFV